MDNTGPESTRVSIFWDPCSLKCDTMINIASDSDQTAPPLGKILCIFLPIHIKMLEMNAKESDWLTWMLKIRAT